MGTSAIFSALNSLPLDEEHDDSDDDGAYSSSDDESTATRQTAQRPTRPKGEIHFDVSH
jgi:hypothetical protein